MKGLYIYKQNKIENKGKIYDLIIYNKLRKTMEYTIVAFGEYKGNFYGKIFEKIFDDKDSEGNRENVLKYEKSFLKAQIM